MVSNEEIENKLKAIEGVSYVKVEGDGYQYRLTVVSNEFLNLSKVARQQWVYAVLKEYITSGSLHAISMKTWTEEEWERQNG